MGGQGSGHEASTVKHRLAIALLLSSTASAASEPAVGRDYWIDRSPATLCRDPSVPGSCRQIKGVQLIIEDYSVRADGRRIAHVKLSTGETGWLIDPDFYKVSDLYEHRHFVRGQLHRQMRDGKSPGDCKALGGASIGMTKPQLVASCWGKPLGTNTTLTAGGDREQLVYGGGNYIYLENGRVTTIQTAK
jgi:hypothetical protein